MPTCFSAGKLKNVLDLRLMHIEDIHEEQINVHAYGEVHQIRRYVVMARPFKRDQCKCPICQRKCVKNGFKQEGPSAWRAPDLNGMQVIISYRPQRIYCPEHGALNEYIPWADGTSRFTAPFNDDVAWLVTTLSKTAICEYKGINWRTVGNCVKAAHDRLEPDITVRMRDLRRICVDETSYKRGYKYITVVYDMDRNRVVWAHEDHGLNVFRQFCEAMPAEERAKVEIIAGDGASWIDECMMYFPNATRCIDSFHVAEWANEALDKIRTRTAAMAQKEYERLVDELNEKAMAAVLAEKEAWSEYADAKIKLTNMPTVGRPSREKLRLLQIIEDYDAAHPNGPPEVVFESKRSFKAKLLPEDEAALMELEREKKAAKGSKHALGHNPENCTQSQLDKIKLIQNAYPDLYKGYQLKEGIRLILHMVDPDQAAIELAAWKEKARSSGLKEMQDLADKIERHQNNIMNTIRYQANSAKSEATNTSIKALIFMARGFRNINNMIALIYLKCSDLIVPLSNRIRPSPEYEKKKRERANELRRQREEAKRMYGIA